MTQVLIIRVPCYFEKWFQLYSLLYFMAPMLCRDDPKFSCRQVLANSADPEEQSDQGLHSSPLHLNFLDALPYAKAGSFKF